ncbi:hypothetical protein BGS_0631 [Beggiatoa sp. SS]|nr:hypothetical protein BGS_0631 [Beggiatoa sp. SS]
MEDNGDLKGLFADVGISFQGVGGVGVGEGNRRGSGGE